MSKLYEVLAVEASLSTVSGNLVKESMKSLKKDNLFTGEVKSHTVFGDENQHLVQAVQSRAVTTTVMQNLEYTLLQGIAPFWDAVAQKDEANQRAKADIIINGEVLVAQVAGTTLLGLEAKLSSLLELFSTVPTLPPGIRWELDASQGEDIFINPVSEERMQSVRIPDHKVLYEATPHHPAQIEKFETTKDIGKFKLQSYSGMISPLDKANLIKRLQTLISATKQARQRANAVEIGNVHIGNTLANYLLGK